MLFSIKNARVLNESTKTISKKLFTYFLDLLKIFFLFPGLWRDTVCKKSVRHCTACHIAKSQQIFSLRGLCDESRTDRGYFLLNGRKEDAERTRMRPVYEGYFSKLEWIVAGHPGAEKRREDLNNTI